MFKEYQQQYIHGAAVPKDHPPPADSEVKPATTDTKVASSAEDNANDKPLSRVCAAEKARHTSFDTVMIACDIFTNMTEEVKHLDDVIDKGNTSPVKLIGVKTNQHVEPTVEIESAETEVSHGVSKVQVVCETDGNDAPRVESATPPSASVAKTMTEAQRRWILLKKSRGKIREIGVKEGVLQPKNKKTKPTILNVDPALDHEKEVRYHKLKGRENDVEIPVKEISLMYEAIPFLPMAPSTVCMILNFIIPGSGTVLSGFFLICCGQPRVQLKGSRVVTSILINIVVGVCQLATVTFLLVGWVWSIAWGGLLMSHALKYRAALRDKKDTVVATAALEAFSKETLTRRRQVHKLVKHHRLKMMLQN